MKEELYEDIEPEGNENLDIQIPFDPNLIKISNRPMTLGEIIERLKINRINLFTEYQRIPDLWSAAQKSKLIESILLRLPLPNFYFDADDENNWGVVDGLQRISTLKSFIIDQTLVLEKLEFLTQYNGMRYEELPRPMQRRILIFSVNVYIIEKGTPDVVKYNIFSRINQGGLKLEPQEIRHALHQGKPAQLVAELVRGVDLLDGQGNVIALATEEGKAFVKATGGKIRADRMQDRDFATRFVAFYLIDYREYEPDLDSFLNKGMGKIKYLSDDQVQKLKDDFIAAMELAWDVFGEDAFRKRVNSHQPKKPINKAIFEVFSVLFAKLPEFQRLEIRARKSILKDQFKLNLSIPGNLYLNSFSTGTALKEMVQYRFTFSEMLIKQNLPNA